MDSVRNHSISEMAGIGPKRQQCLMNYGIHTIGDLAEAKSSDVTELPTTQMNRYILSAQKLLNSHNETTNTQKPTNLTTFTIGPQTLHKLSNLSQNVTHETKNNISEDVSSSPPVNQEPEQFLNKNIEIDNNTDLSYMSEHHNWWQQVVGIPRTNKHGIIEFKQALIHELCIDPKFNRISFLCSWKSNHGNKTICCSKTYSPQFLIFFNDLPCLEVYINESDFQKVNENKLLENVVSEIMFMKMFKQ